MTHLNSKQVSVQKTRPFLAVGLGLRIINPKLVES